MNSGKLLKLMEEDGGNKQICTHSSMEKLSALNRRIVGSTPTECTIKVSTKITDTFTYTESTETKWKQVK